jgi:hypothetical protein
MLLRRHSTGHFRRMHAEAGGAAGKARDPSKRQRKRSRGPHILMAAPQAAPCTGGDATRLRVADEDEQRQQSGNSDEDAHPSKVGRRCFEPVSAL